MDLPQVQNCCFGLTNLRNGAIIAGIVTLFIELGWHGYGLSYGDTGLTSLLHSIYIGLMICAVIASCLLIWGVLKKEKRFVFFYIVIYALLIIATIVLTVYYLFKYEGHMYDSIGGTVLYVLITLYCLIVVNSYHSSM